MKLRDFRGGGIVLVDYHVHLDKLEWNIDTIGAMCSRAKEAGVDRVGVVLHTRVLDEFLPLYAHIIDAGREHRNFKFDRSMKEYANLLALAKDRGYPVDMGLEVCYSPEGEEFLRQKLSEYPFDFMISSVHLIDGMHYKTAVETYGSSEEVGEMYYKLIIKAVKSGLFNIIAHMEVVRRQDIPGISHYPDLLDELCRVLVENKCAVEINTKRLTRHEGLLPDKDTLRFMSQRGVKLSFGSDAHHIERIGFAREQAVEHIIKGGFRGFYNID